jgi:hypothetical protein
MYFYGRRDQMTRSSSKMNIIDVGSAGGIESPWRLNNIGMRLCFDPCGQSPIEKDTDIFVPVAVGSHNGSLQLRVSGENASGTSVHEQNLDWVEKAFPVIKSLGNEGLNSTWFERSKSKSIFECECLTLDTVLSRRSEYGIPDGLKFSFVKIDIQAFELSVLKGSRQFVAVTSSLLYQLIIQHTFVHHRTQTQGLLNLTRKLHTSCATIHTR